MTRQGSRMRREGSQPDKVRTPPRGVKRERGLVLPRIRRLALQFLNTMRTFFIRPGQADKRPERGSMHVPTQVRSPFVKSSVYAFAALTAPCSPKTTTTPTP